MKQILALGLMAGLMMSCGEERKCSDEYVASRNKAAALVAKLRDIRSKLNESYNGGYNGGYNGDYNGGYNGDYNGNDTHALKTDGKNIQFELANEVDTFNAKFPDATICVANGKNLVHANEMKIFNEELANIIL